MGPPSNPLWSEAGVHAREHPLVSELAPDVYRVVKELVDLKTAPLHPLLRRSAALVYKKRWWGMLSVGAQTGDVLAPHVDAHATHRIRYLYFQ